MFICEKCHGVGCHEPGCPDYVAYGAPVSDPTVTPTPTEAVTATFGHGCITLTWYPSSQRVGVVQRGQNAVMDEWEFVEFARQMTAAAPSPAVSARDLDAIRAEWRTVIRIESPSDAVLVPVEHLATVEAALAAAHAETRGETDRANQWERAQAETVAEWEADSARLTAERDEVRAALDAHALANGGCVPADAYRDLAAHTEAAEAALAALRERIEGLHRPDDHGPGRCDKDGCITSCVECGDDWPCATVRALAAAPSETEEGR